MKLYLKDMTFFYMTFQCNDINKSFLFFFCFSSSSPVFAHLQFAVELTFPNHFLLHNNLKTWHVLGKQDVWPPSQSNTFSVFSLFHMPTRSNQLCQNKSYEHSRLRCQTLQSITVTLNEHGWIAGWASLRLREANLPPMNRSLPFAKCLEH